MHGKRRLLSRATGAQTNVLTDAGGGDGQVGWRPDGREVAFSSRRGGLESRANPSR